MPSVLITGTNRGIGLEFVRQYAKDGWQVYACCRDPQNATALQAIEGNVQLLCVDVSSDESVSRLKHTLLDRPLDVLVNNAGVYSEPTAEPHKVDTSLFGDVLNVNVTGPARMIGAFGDNVIKTSGKIATLSSMMGSMGSSTGGGYYAYRASKAGVNALTSAYSKYFEDQGVSVISLCPGWVKTDMGGPNASIEVEECVSGLRRVIADLTMDGNGKFFTYTGEERVW